MDLHKPWRCQVCNKLMYILDLERKIITAPSPKYYDLIWTKVCTLCFQMATHEGFTTNYWRELHSQFMTETEKQRRKNDGLTGRTDYFTGA